MRTATINIHRVNKDGYRFEGKYFLNDHSFLSMQIEDIKACNLLGDFADVFNPPVFKRQFCKETERSIPYFQSSDVQNASENSNVHIFGQQAHSLNLLVKTGDILITGFGTIGNTRIVNRHQNDACYANNVCRVRIHSGVFNGFIYAVLSSKYGVAQLNKNASGSVVRYIEAPGIRKTLIPKFSVEFQKNIDGMIQESIRLREETSDILEFAEKLLKEKTGLRDLKPEDYDYYGTHTYNRDVSCFTVNRTKLSTISINAFNYSKRIEEIKQLISTTTKPIKEIIVSGLPFSTGSFPRIEVTPGNGVLLINQSDIFDNIIKGKNISSRNVKLDNLVRYGEVIIAGVGTLGENETFCRAIFAYEDLVGQLISGEFIRMKTIDSVPSGYLYTWLNSDYGFRLIRNTQAGTKLCRPIPKLFIEIPVPIIEERFMKEIDCLVREAHTKRHQANKLEREAIARVEVEIEKWSRSNNQSK